MFLLQFSMLLVLYGGICCLEPTYDVISPKTQKLGVPGKINVGPFGHKGSLLGQVTSHSNLDNSVTHESQQLHLSPTYQHQRFSSYKNKLEDSTSRDEMKHLLYFQEKKDFIKEKGLLQSKNSRLMVTQERNTDLKTPKRSKRQLENVITKEAQKISLERQKKCCWDGYNDYMKDQNCYKRLQEMKNKPNCYKPFARCCTIAKDYYEKAFEILQSPGSPRVQLCVQMPKYWKVDEPQKVTILKPMVYFSDDSYLVRILILSYPDKTVTYNSQEFLLIPKDKTEEIDVSLLLKLEDLPNRDEMEKFVYLVVEFKGRTIEVKVPLLDLHVTQHDLKKLNILSVWESLESEIEPMRLGILMDFNGFREDLESEIKAIASKYPLERAKSTCLQGFMHYIQEEECQNKLTQLEKKGTPGLYRVFRKCCLYTRKYYHKLANTRPQKYNINFRCEEE